MNMGRALSRSVLQMPHMREAATIGSGMLACSPMASHYVTLKSQAQHALALLLALAGHECMHRCADHARPRQAPFT